MTGLHKKGKQSGKQSGNSQRKSGNSENIGIATTLPNVNQPVNMAAPTNSQNNSFQNMNNQTPQIGTILGQARDTLYGQADAAQFHIPQQMQPQQVLNDCLHNASSCQQYRQQSPTQSYTTPQSSQCNQQVQFNLAQQQTQNMAAKQSLQKQISQANVLQCDSQYKQPMYTDNTTNNNTEQCVLSEAPPWVNYMLDRFDARLQSIEAQLLNQNSRWQQIDAQLQNQNSRMVNMEQKLAQIDEVKQSIAQVKINVTELDKQVDYVQSQIINYDQSISTYSELCDDVISENTENKKTIDSLSKRIATIEKQQETIKSKQQQTEEKLTDIQWRSMRENLIFTGNDEDETDVSNENCEGKLKEFLSSKLNIHDEMPLDRVHRLGKYKSQQSFPRPIIAKFHRFRDREKIRFAAPETLKGTRYGVREQFPVEIENKRKVLYPIMKKARENKDNKVRLVRDKLFINNVEAMPDPKDVMEQCARPKTFTNTQQNRLNQRSVTNRQNQNTTRTFTSRNIYASKSRNDPDYMSYSVQTSNRYERLANLGCTPAPQAKISTTRKQPAFSPLENDFSKKLRDDATYECATEQILDISPQEPMDTQILHTCEFTESSGQSNAVLTNGPVIHMNGSDSGTINGQTVSRDNSPAERNSVNDNAH